MIAAVAILLIVGVLVDWGFRRAGIPGLVGMLAVGVIAGPHLLGWISPSLVALSEDLRVGALIIILLRAGLEVSRETLAKVGVRVLLLSTVPAIIEGAAVTAVKIEGVLHEFSPIQGVVEDATDIILNLKQVPMRLHVDHMKTLRLKANTAGEVTAGDIETDADVEILEPEVHILSLIHL